MANTLKRGAITLDRAGYKIAGERFQRVSTIKGVLGGGEGLIRWAGEAVAKKVRSLCEGYTSGQFPVEALLIALQKDDLARAYEETRDAACDFGSAFHDVVEAVGSDDWSKLKELPLTPEFWTSVDQFKQWTERVQPVWERNEFIICHPELRVAGQCDALAIINGKRWLIDVKTSKSVYGPEYALQLAAYRYAPFIVEWTGEMTPMPAVDHCGILHVPKTGDACTLYELRVEEADFEAFKACHSLYWFKRGYPAPSEAPLSFDLAFSG